MFQASSFHQQVGLAGVQLWGNVRCVERSVDRGWSRGYKHNGVLYQRWLQCCRLQVRHSYLHVFSLAKAKKTPLRPMFISQAVYILPCLLQPDPYSRRVLLDIRLVEWYPRRAGDYYRWVEHVSRWLYILSLRHSDFLIFLPNNFITLHFALHLFENNLTWNSR